MFEVDPSEGELWTNIRDGGSLGYIEMDDIIKTSSSWYSVAPRTCTKYLCTLTIRYSAANGGTH